MSLNTVSYSRSIYSVFDLLGDVGGLYSILLDIGAIIAMIPAFVFGSSLDRFLRSEIFNIKSIQHDETKPKLRKSCIRDKR